jgi:GntR family transcriptional regulator
VFTIDASDPTPLYAQLERAIRAGIATGRLQPGEKLPTVRQLAVELRINANTVAKVYGELERTGVLETRRGVGTFIRGAGTRPASLGDADRQRQLRILADRFLAGAAELGFPAGEAIAFLEARSSDGKQEKCDA